MGNQGWDGEPGLDTSLRVRSEPDPGSHSGILRLQVQPWILRASSDPMSGAAAVRFDPMSVTAAVYSTRPEDAVVSISGAMYWIVPISAVMSVASDVRRERP